MNQSKSLPRVLGPWMATALVIGTIIGSGVFKKPFAVSQNITDFALVVLAWVLGGALALFGSLALAEVAVILPRAGGNYVFLREAYGRIAGFLWGWVDFWIIRTGSIAALAAVFSESVHDAVRQALKFPPGTDVMGFWPRQLLTITVIFALALVNIRGVKWGGLLQLVVTIVKVASLLAVIVLPFVVLALVQKPQFPPSVSNFTPVMPKDWGAVNWSGFGAAMVGVIWAYHGWMNIAPVAEEVKNPQRNIPLALLGGVVVVILLYLGANLAYYLVIPRDDMILLKDTTVATAFSERLLGPVGGVLVSIAIGISVFGALNGNVLVGPRLLYAMGDDGLASPWLSRVHPRFQTPAAATLVMCGWSMLMVLVVAIMFRQGVFGDPDKPGSKAPFDVITDYAMFGAIALETLAVLAVIMLRVSRPNAERPYRCPGYPLVPVLYALVMGAVWINMFRTQHVESVIGIAFILAGAAVYVLFLMKPK